MGNFPAFFHRSNHPFQEMLRLQREVDRMFEQLNGSPSFNPSARIQETETQMVLTVDLPGVKKEDIQVELSNDMLRVYGERKEERETKKGGTAENETFFGSFDQSFMLPAGTKAEQLETDYSNGVLKIRYPKSAGTKPRQIEIGESKKETKAA